MADNRVYLRLKRGSADPIFDYPVMAPLKKFGGVMFPYTPIVQAHGDHGLQLYILF